VLVVKSLELMTQELGALSGTVVALRKVIENHRGQIVTHQETNGATAMPCIYPLLDN